MDKFVILKGCAGLGNRLITLCKAIEYAKRTKRILYVDWGDGMFGEKGKNIFYKYFSLSGVKRIYDGSIIEKVYRDGATCYPALMQFCDIRDDIYSNYSISTSFLGKNPIYRMLWSPLARGKACYLLGLQSWHRTKVRGGYFYALKRMFSGKTMPLGGNLSYKLEEDIICFADFRPTCHSKSLTRHIELKEPLLGEITEFAMNNDLGEKAIGVHIRATDKMFHGSKSSLFKKIDQILQKEPGHKIFLSTDNAEVLDEFRSRYKNIIVYPKFLPKEGSDKGLHHWAKHNKSVELKEQMFKESLFDMWLLSMCKYLFWQGNSSFSYISKVLKDDEKTTFNWISLR